MHSIWVEYRYLNTASVIASIAFQRDSRTLGRVLSDFVYNTYSVLYLHLSSAKTLQISYIGMETQEVEIKPNMRILLKANTEVLDEVMVVAYGTAKKSSFTGSASVVSGEKIAKMQTSNVSKSLEGAMAGVQISQSSGQPGASANIYVRGIGSISAGREALIVVEVYPMKVI